MGKKKIPCPVCGKLMFEYEDSYDICDDCYWEDDQLQKEEPDLAGGPNRISLNQYRKEWEERPDGLRGEEFFDFLRKKYPKEFYWWEEE